MSWNDLRLKRIYDCIYFDNDDGRLVERKKDNDEII